MLNKPLSESESESGDLRPHRGHYDVNVMMTGHRDTQRRPFIPEYQDSSPNNNRRDTCVMFIYLYTHYAYFTPLPRIKLNFIMHITWELYQKRI